MCCVWTQIGEPYQKKNGIAQGHGWRHPEGEHWLAGNSAVMWTFFQTAG